MATDNADIIFYGGNIYTLDDKNPKIEAIAIKGERIIDVGKYSRIKQRRATKETQMVDLKGKTLLPGLIETHQHPTLAAMSLTVFKDVCPFSKGRTCPPLTSNEIEKIIRDEIAIQDPSEDPLPWSIFQGWDVELNTDLPFLSAKIIEERYSKEIPVMIIAQNGHSAWVNHKTLEVCGITHPDQAPPGGIYVADENGELTGQLLEEPAIMSVLYKSPPLANMTEEQQKASFQKQWKEYASKGFTTVADLAYHPSPRSDKCMNEVSMSPDCPIRISLYISGGTPEPEITENSKLRVLGAKFWADGSPHCGLAATKDYYLANEITEKLGFPPPPNRGLLNWSDQELERKVREFHYKGKQISIHANGERAIDQSLNIFKKLMKPSDDRRHRLEHVCFITEEQAKTCAQLGVVTSALVDHLHFYGESLTKYIVGKERTDRITLLATLVREIKMVSIHQDHPAFPDGPHPFGNMKSAITRTCYFTGGKVYGPQYRIPIQEAIKAYTTGAAYQLFREHEIGSLEVGKLADLVILSNDPYIVKPTDLDTAIEVVETYIGGRCNNINNN